MNFDVDSHLVLQVLGGSHAYGMAGPDSDLDLRGVIIPPEEYFCGLEVFEQYVPGNEEDICYYDVRKFFSLAMKGNPNVLEFFKAPVLRTIDPFAERIRQMWDMVISKRLVTAHLGMSTAHLAKLERPGKNCGEKGRRAITAFGYNTKDATHLVRVLEQCLEILITGDLTLPRPNAIALKRIKAGDWKVEQVRSVAEYLMNEIRKTENTSPLPKEPDFHKVNKEVCAIVRDWLNR